MQKHFLCLFLLLTLLSCSSSNPNAFSISFDSDVTTIVPNSSATLSWKVAGAQIAETGTFASTGCTFSFQVDGQDFSAPEAVACQVEARIVSPDVDTTYRLTALKTLPDTVAFEDISIRVADTTNAPPLANTPPFVDNDKYQVTRGESIVISAASGVLSNDVDNDGDPLSAQLVKTTQNGSLTLNSDGSFSYTHDGGSSSTDSFTYQASDGTDISPTATAFIEVSDSSSSNTAPIANSDNYLFKADEELDIPASRGVLVNDGDLDGDSLSATLVSTTSNGKLILASDGGFKYTPDEGAINDTFSYQASDGQANSAIVTVTLILEVPDPPPTPTLTFIRQIDSSADDVEEHLAGGSNAVGSIFLDSPDLDIGEDSAGPKLVGIRFVNVTLAKDATIEDAHIQFTVDTTETSNGAPTINVYLVRSINAPAFSSTPFALTSLLGDALLATTWTPPAWSSGDSGEAQRLDVTELLQGVVRRPAWESSNSIALILEATGGGVRIADSVDGNPAGAATLVVNYKE